MVSESGIAARKQIAANRGVLWRGRGRCRLRGGLSLWVMDVNLRQGAIHKG